MPLLLEGQVYDRDQLIESMQDEIEQLRSDLIVARAESARAVQQANRAVAKLRTILSPLYGGLRELFGELDKFGGDEMVASPADDSRTKAVWENWKQKMPGNPAKIIDALLLHGEMNTQQVAIAIGLHRTSIPKLIYQLNQAGLINKNGGKFSLKKL
jgi:hypothetical protein